MDGMTLLRQASEAGLAVAAQGNKLVIRGPRRAEPVARLLIERKREVLAALSTVRDQETCEPQMTGYRGGTVLDWADGISRLGDILPPAAMRPERWHGFHGRAIAFMDTWATEAAVKGWSGVDLFGCHRERPDARLDCAGLLWFPGTIESMTAATATLVRNTKSRLSYRRRMAAPSEPVVLAWELGK
jgi:hypothetical protein